MLTELHTGGKFGGGGYATSGGLHGVGIKATNALSTWLMAESRRDGVIYRQCHRRGLPETGVEIYSTTEKLLGEVGQDNGLDLIATRQVADWPGGTTITFAPSDEFLSTTRFDFDTLAYRLQEIAFQVPVRITLTDERDEHRAELTYQYEGGLPAWLAFLNQGKPLRHQRPIYVSTQEGAESGPVMIELAVQYHSDANNPEGVIISTVNTIPTPDGGKHVSGFRAGLTKAVNVFAAEKRLLKKGGDISGKDLLYGLSAIIKVLMPEPQFTSQTKSQLASDYIQGIVSSVAYNALLTAFRQTPSMGRAIVSQAQAAAQARQAEAKVRASMMRKSILEVSNLPGKLADCDARTDPRLTALYIVEGDSAGGSCKLARDRRYHAILPARGKILNVWRANLNKALSNKEISAIISAIGGGVGGDFALDAVRYGMVVIMVDADVDGGHIGALLLTLGFKFMRKLVSAGRLWWAVAPLYQIRVGQKQVYAYSDRERDEIIASRSGDYEVQRYKGLGEMNPEQLRETVFAIDEARLAEAKENILQHEALVANWQAQEADDDRPLFKPIALNRHLVQIRVEDLHAAEASLELLMGTAVEPRKRWLLSEMGREGVGH